MSASNFLENKLLDHSLRYGSAPYTAPTTLYVALFKYVASVSPANALETNTGISTYEISGGSYSRPTLTFSAASGGVSATSATVSFTTATADWGTITHVAIMDASTAGNVLYWGEATVAKTILNGDTFSISSGNLTVAFD